MRCGLCGRPVFQHGAGRPRIWCSDSCRNIGKARVRRLRVKLDAALEAGREHEAAQLMEWIDRLEVNRASTAQACR